MYARPVFRDEVFIDRNSGFQLPAAYYESFLPENFSGKGLELLFYFHFLINIARIILSLF